MTIAIFHNAENADTAQNIGKLIAPHAREVSFFLVTQIWRKEFYQNPVLLLDGVSHAVFLYSRQEPDYSSYIFFAGYCLGKGIRVMVVELEAGSPIPENCRHLGVILKPESVEEFFIAEKARFALEEKRSRARNQLLERGISCFEENFVLIVAAGDLESASLFLEAGFDPALVDSRGIPILSTAVRSGNTEIAALLIDAGAEINRPSGDRGYSPLMDAAQRGDAAMVNLLLDKGADPGVRSKDGQTALIVCAGRGDVAMSRTLVEHGADPLVVDSLGMSAAGYAHLFGNAELSALFNKGGA
jgi:hypothetical protein